MSPGKRNTVLAGFALSALMGMSPGVHAALNPIVSIIRPLPALSWIPLSMVRLGIDEQQTPAERRASMTWAQRLKRVFGIDVQTCRACGGALEIIACIEDPVVIEKILSHLEQEATSAEPCRLPPSRAPPRAGLSDG